MKTIEKEELFENVRQFLKRKGIELTEGSYAQTIQKSCRIVVDVVNMGQHGLERAKTGIDKKLDQVREVIHRKTAPKSPRAAKTAGAAPVSERPAAATGEAATETAAPPPIVPEVGMAEPPAKAKKVRPAKKKTARKSTRSGSAMPGKANK